MIHEEMDTIGTLFEEEQRFTQGWLWMILVPIVIGAVLFVVASTYQQLIMGEPFGDKPLSNVGLMIANLFILLVGVGLPVAILTTKLVVSVDQTQLTVKYSYLAHKQVPVSEIVSWVAKQYSPIREYGGWGVRYSFKNKRWAYIVKGNRGVELDLADGRRWLIGSQRAQELAEALTKAKGL